MFQQVYFMLRYSFKAKRLEQGKELVKLSHKILLRIKKENQEAYNFLNIQIQKGEDYDIALLKISFWFSQY